MKMTIDEENTLLKLDNADRLAVNINDTFLVCIDLIVEKTAKQFGTDKAVLYLSFMLGGKHYKIAKYILGIVQETSYAAVKAAQEADLPNLRDSVRLPFPYDGWNV